MMKTSIAILALTLAAGTTSAQAMDFNGFYAGADIGAGSLQYDVPGTDLTAHDGGVAYGAFGGWRTNITPHWIAGVEARIGDTDANVDAGALRLSSGRQWSASGLIGYQLGERWTLFGTLGYENLRTTATGGTTLRHKSLDGLRLSLGAEYAMTEQISLRVSSVGSVYEDSNFQGAKFDNTSFGSLTLSALYTF